MTQADLGETIAAALEAVDEHRLVETARLLIDCPSPTGAERRCAEALAARMAAHGVDAAVDTFDGDRANVVATVGRREDGLAAMLNGHLDTTGYGDERDRAWLYEAGPSDAPRAVVADGILSGLGAYNMKGGVAAAAEAVLALATVGERLPGSVSLAAVAGESEKAPVDGLLASFSGPDLAGGGIGSRRLLDRGPRPDAVVICEPSGLAVVNAQPGYVLLQLLVRGRAGYLPGAVAPTTIDAAAAAVGAIREWAADYAESAALDCGLGTLRPTATLGAIEGGWPFKPGGTPAAVALYVDLRIPPHIATEGPIDALAASAAAAVGAIGPFTVDHTVFARHVPGALVPATHLLVQTAIEAVARATGEDAPEPLDMDFPPGDDGKIFAAAGIPYVKVGPGTPVGRDPRFGREQVRIAELAAAARTYVVLGATLATLDAAASAGWPSVGDGPAGLGAGRSGPAR